ncbi:ATP-binding cassette subfamily C protein CydCD [Arthrobacter sp. CAN_A6]|uniref:thiol reductant ABC exporter subunit CydD n=1 Tax=Arthrobacter sp. CAN_A6 TaxID=2787721 RepID=UPI0018CA9BFB
MSGSFNAATAGRPATAAPGAQEQSAAARRTQQRTAGPGPTAHTSPVALLLAGGPAGAAGSRIAVYLLGALAAVRAAGLVLMAQALAVGIACLAEGSLRAGDVLVPGIVGIVLRTAAAWGQEATAARLALGVKERLREAALRRLLADGGTSGAAAGGQGSLAVLLTRGLDGLDKYYTQYLPALITCAVVPLLVGARILAADWISALVIVLTVPLVPVFMVLIGLHTQERTQEAATALGRLSDHLLELARGLPVLVGLGRAAEQTRALRDIANDYTSRTLMTLRTAFLSSLALELISTISVAVVAVFAGVRLISGDLGLETALVALILAPECYGPLRDVGAAHHASEDGEEAGARIRAVIDAPVPVPLATGPGWTAGVDAPLAAESGRTAGFDAPLATGPSVDGAITVRELSAHYDGALRPVFEDVSFVLRPGTVTALRGASGTGKTTLLKILKRRTGLPGTLGVTGSVSGTGPDRIAWVPQHPELLMDTVRAELGLYAGLPDDAPAIDAQLAAVGGAGLADRQTGELSPGEVRRVAVARALLRARDPRIRLLLLDEPTAHVDPATSAAIRSAILGRPSHVAVLLIAHDDETAAIADRQLWMDQLSAPADPALPWAARPPDEGSGVAVPLPLVRWTNGTAPARRAPSESDAGAGRQVSGGSAGRPIRVRFGSARAVLALVRPWDRRFLTAAALGLGAALFAVALTALSGWLIVRAAEQPPILYLLTAIVGVRFFGIGRSLLRYSERLWLHGAVFTRADATRLRLWKGLLEASTSWRTIARGSGDVERLIGDVDELRDLSSRAVLPFVTAVLTGCAALLTTALLHPAALGWQLLAVVAAVLVAPVTAVLRERSAGAAAVRVRAAALQRTTGLLRAAPDLQVNGANERALEIPRGLDAEVSAAARRSASAAGAALGVIVAACCTAAVGILFTVQGLPAETAAVLVLLQLALIEPFAAGASAVQHWGPLAAVTQRIAPRLATSADAEPGPSSALRVSGPSTFSSLALRNAAVGYEPGRPVVADVDVHLGKGRWTGLTGPSGSGKSTILGALLGFLPLEHGELLGNGSAVIPGRRPRVAWCPQESHLFSSTVRANLQLARPLDDAASDAELQAALGAVGLAGFVEGLERGIDATVGPGGSRLSGGQRQRLAVARALLTRADVVLLDEPTAHLDADGARALLGDLRAGLTDRAVLLVTHNAAEARACDDVVTLGTAALGRAGDAASGLDDSLPLGARA